MSLREVLFRKNHKNEVSKIYDREHLKPVLKCSICNGEQVAGFKDIRTGEFHEIICIKDARDLDKFMEEYDIDVISKEY